MFILSYVTQGLMLCRFVILDTGLHNIKSGNYNQYVIIAMKDGAMIVNPKRVNQMNVLNILEKAF